MAPTMQLLYVLCSISFCIAQQPNININFADTFRGAGLQCGGGCAHHDNMDSKGKESMPTTPCNGDIPDETPPMKTSVEYNKEWGHGDTLGALNYLTPDITRQAASLVKTGQSFALGVLTSSKTPAWGTRHYQTWAKSIIEPPAGPTGTVAHDDYMRMHNGIGSQIDGLGHVGVNHEYYNKKKFPAVTDASVDDTGALIVETDGLEGGLDLLDVASLPPITTRGLIIDVAGYKGVTALDDGYVITVDDLKGALRKQGKCIRQGDVVLIHTGYAPIGDQDSTQFDPQRFMASEPGIGVNAANWLAKNKIVAVGADTWGLEQTTGTGGNKEERGLYEPHQILLAHNGVYILENMNVGPVLKAGIDECMFVLGVPRLAGSVQAIINPVCIA